jgi:sialic acid synthase SpsE
MKSDQKVLFKLGNVHIDLESKPFLIAEIGVNHGGSVAEAKKLIESAKRGGADAVKFQTYKADKLVDKSAKFYWDTREEATVSQFELFKKYDSLNENDYVELARFSREIGIFFSSTPFDLDAVQYLDDIVDFFKIASADITNFPLISEIASKKKSIILSTGASTIEEIQKAVNLINEKSGGESEVAIMHCILNYPTLDLNSSLNMIKDIQKNFSKNIIGLSDHSTPDNNISAISISYILGARIFEKHFTLNTKLKGNDHYHSYDENLLKQEINNLRLIQTKLGIHLEKVPLNSELQAIRQARRSLFINRDLAKGATISKKDLICKRPGLGISPTHFYEILDKKLTKDKNNGELLDWSDFE